MTAGTRLVPAADSYGGRMVPLPRSDVDTDQIIPSDYCRRLGRTGFAEGLFAGWREDPAFVLNDPVRAGAPVLVAAANFGTGSSREPAVWALAQWGFRAVVAESFGDIFQRNAFTNGLLAIRLPRDRVAALRELALADPAAEVTIDLDRCVLTTGGEEWEFAVPERARWLLLNGLDEIAVTLDDDPAITAFEARRPGWLPAATDAPAGA